MFGAVKLTKNTDIDKNKYSGCSIRSDSRGTFLFLSGKFAQNIITFGVDMSSSAQLITRKKDISFLGAAPTQGLDDRTLIAEKKYSINFIESERKLSLSLHYNDANSYLFVKRTGIIKFKAKESEIVAKPLCLGNISEDFTLHRRLDRIRL